MGSTLIDDLFIFMLACFKRSRDDSVFADSYAVPVS
jgi:hypothetical protein